MKNNVIIMILSVLITVSMTACGGVKEADVAVGDKEQAPEETGIEGEEGKEGKESLSFQETVLL